MGPMRLFLGLSVLTSAVLYTQTAPTVSDLFGPPRTLEGDTDVNPSSKLGIPLIDETLNKYSETVPKRNFHEDITEDERFHRTYENGTIEFKTALSNGHIQYQRISNKVVNGKTIQVYEGYVSERYADGRYGTNYYIADENGYRRTPVEIGTVPPALPRSGHYAPDQQPEISVSGKSFAEQEEVSNEKSALSEDENALGNGSRLPAEHVSKRHNAIKPESPLSEDVDLGASTEIPVTDENTVKATEGLEVSQILPRNEENASTSVENDVGQEEITTELPADENTVKATEDPEASPTPMSTEDNTSSSFEGKATSTEVPAWPVTEENAVISAEEIESTPAIPVTAEKASSSIEDDVSHSDTSTENLEASTELPKREENTSSSTEYDTGHSEISTELPVAEENIVKTTEVLEASPAISTTEDSESAFTEDNVTSTEVPTWAVTEENAAKSAEELEATPVIPTTIENTSSSVENKADHNKTDTEDLEASTELPISQANTSSSIENDASYSEISTELPANGENIVKTTEDIESSPPLSTTNDNKSSSIEDNVISTVPTWAVTGENAVKSAEDLGVTPAIPTTIENASSSVNDEAAQNETRTEDFEASTELPTSQANKSSSIEDDSDRAEISTELPESEENITKATEDFKASPTILTTGKDTSSSAENNASHSETSTEVPTWAVTEANAVKSAEEIARTPNVVWYAEEHAIHSETSTEVPALPTTEEDILKLIKDIEATPTLPTIEGNENLSIDTKVPTEENIVKQERNSENEASTGLPQLLSAEETLNKVHENIEASTEIQPDKNNKEEDIEPSGVSPITEESVSEMEPSLLPSNEKDVSNLPEEKVSELFTHAPSIEDSSTENNAFETSTDAPTLPILEQRGNNSVENEDAEKETSTDLTANIDDKDLEAIRETPEEHVTTPAASAVPTYEENAIQNAFTEAPAFSTSEDDSVKIDEDVTTSESSTDLSNVDSIEDKTLEASTENPSLPSFEDHAEKYLKDYAGENEINADGKNESTASPKNEEGVTNAAEEIGDFTEQPATPNLIDILTKKIQIPIGVPITNENISQFYQNDVSEIELSTEIPTLEDVNPTKGSTNQEASPELPITEEILRKIIAGNAPQSESSTQLPNLDVTQAHDDLNLEAATEVPALALPEETLTKIDEQVNTELSTDIPSVDVSKPSENKNLEELFPKTDDPIQNESITDLPALANSNEKHLEGSTEVPVLAVTENKYIHVHIGEPASDISKANTTKTVIDRENDLLAVENTEGNAVNTSDDKEFSTEVPALSKSEENLNKTIEEGVTKSEAITVHSSLSGSEEGSGEDHVNY